jgi:hypothetical protein
MITEKQYKESMKQKSWFFEKINKTNKPLTMRKRTQINKTRYERGKTVSRRCWRRGVKTSEKTASPGHNNSLKNGGQEERKGRKGIKE